MNINIQQYPQEIPWLTQNILQRLHSPVCGMIQEIGFATRATRDSRIMTSGVDLTGVHTYLGRPHPGPAGYHIGGSGFIFQETLIRSLGESIERYSQLMCYRANIHKGIVASYREMISKNEPVVPKEKLLFYSQEQYKQAGFPFVPLNEDARLVWVPTFCISTEKLLWVPAQLLFVGYQLHHAQHEPWISASVTTGTAAHTDKVKALLNAILEIIQIDSAMGHWYSNQVAPRIIFDERTAALENIIKQAGEQHKYLSFHWLQNPDLHGFSIACVYYYPSGLPPKLAVGLGADTQLESAMYKAYLEMMGVISLARLNTLERTFSNQEKTINPATIYDVDSNVSYYALGNNLARVREKFSHAKVIKAKDMPNDDHGSQLEQLNHLLRPFEKKQMNLVYTDMTLSEADDLGFVVPRVWSPDLLSLCLPSIPWKAHPRFLEYGGCCHADPHPYP